MSLKKAMFDLCFDAAQKMLRETTPIAVPFKGQNKEKVLCFLEQAQQPLPAPFIAAKLGLNKGTVISALAELQCADIVTKRRKRRRMGRIGAPPMLYTTVLR